VDNEKYAAVLEGKRIKKNKEGKQQANPAHQTDPTLPPNYHSTLIFSPQS